MTTHDFFHNLSDRRLWYNILMMVATVIVIVIVLSILARCYTRHGEEIKVPNIVHHNYEAMVDICDDKGLVLEVNDSTYDPKYPGGTILKQSPMPGEMVKAGHVVYVTVNSLTIPTMPLPDVINNATSREAVAKLKVKNFKLGPIEFVPGEKDLVVGVRCNGRQIKAGDRVSIYDVIILQVGDGRLNDSQSVEYIDPIEDVDPDVSDVTIEEGGTDVNPSTQQDNAKDEFLEVKE